MSIELSKKERLRLANEKIEQLEKEIASANSGKDGYWNQLQEKNRELEQLHQFLDAVPNSPPREKEGKHSWDSITLNVMTRLSAWLATKDVKFSEKSSHEIEMR